jgi:TATA-binding protein-associated factor Taf7
MLKFADLSLIVIIVGIIILIGACYYLWQQQSHLSREIKSLQYKLNGLSPLPASSLEQQQQQHCSMEVRSTSPITMERSSLSTGGVMENMMKGMLQQIVDIPQLDDSSEEEEEQSDDETTNSEIETDEESETEVESEKEDDRQSQQEESQEITMMNLEDVPVMETFETVNVLPETISSAENVKVEEEPIKEEQPPCNELDTLRQIKDVNKIKKVLELKKRSDLQLLCDQLQIQFKPSGG